MAAWSMNGCDRLAFYAALKGAAESLERLSHHSNAYPVEHVKPNSTSTVRFVWLNQPLSQILQAKRPVRLAACGYYPMSIVDLQSPVTPRS